MKAFFVDSTGVDVTGDGLFWGDYLAWQHLRRCARMLGQAMCVTDVRLSVRPSGLDWRSAVPEMEIIPLHDRRYARFRKLRKLYSYFASLPSIKKAAARADVAYLLFPSFCSLLGFWAVRKAGVPFGLLVRSVSATQSPLWIPPVRRASFVITDGPVLADWARQYCKDVEVATPMCPLSMEDVPQQKHASSKGPWNLLFVGHDWRRKGGPELAQAVSNLRRRGYEVTLLVIGAVNRWGDEFLLNGADGIHVVGPVSDRAQLRRYYQQADLFCLPSHDEGFPRVLYEAMLYKVPIVTTFVGSIPGLMKDGENCLRVEVGNPQQLADVIQRALDDCALRQRLMDNGLRTVEPIVRKMMEESCDQQLLRKLRQYARSEAG